MERTKAMYGIQLRNEILIPLHPKACLEFICVAEVGIHRLWIWYGSFPSEMQWNEIPHYWFHTEMSKMSLCDYLNVSFALHLHCRLRAAVSHRRHPLFIVGNINWRERQNRHSGERERETKQTNRAGKEGGGL